MIVILIALPMNRADAAGAGTQRFGLLGKVRPPDATLKPSATHSSGSCTLALTAGAAATPSMPAAVTMEIEKIKSPKQSVERMSVIIREIRAVVLVLSWRFRCLWSR
jgi:hypothetical protein